MKPWLASALTALLLAPGSLPLSAERPDYLNALPSDAAAREALAASPQIQVAQQQLAYGKTLAVQQTAGAHEWILSSSAQNRDVSGGGRFHEEDVGLTRAFRWLGKAGMDRELGAKMTETAELAFEDAWHEAGRSLLSQWFDRLRAVSEARLLREQLDLHRAQVAASEKRMQAGDVPPVELQLARAELARAEANQARAQQNAELLTLGLHHAFPELDMAAPAELDTPTEPLRTDDEWIAQVIDNNHEIKLAEGEAEVSALAAQRAGRDRIADPSIGVHYGREFDGQERIAGITFSIPIPGAARQNAFAAAQAEARRSRQLAVQVRRKVERDARADVLAVHGGIKQWQLLATLAEQARANADTVALAYMLGEYGLNETLAARRLALETALAAQSAQLDALQAQARLLLDAHRLWPLEHDRLSSHPGHALEPSE